MFALHFLSQPGAFLLLLVKTHGSTQGRTIPPYAPRPCGWPCEGWEAVINVGDKLTVTLENQKHHLSGMGAFQRGQHRDDGGQNQAYTSERSTANDGKRVIARHDQETRQFLVLAGKNLNKFCIYHCVSELDHFPDAFHKIQNYKSKKPAPKDVIIPALALFMRSSAKVSPKAGANGRSSLPPERSAWIGSHKTVP